MSVGLHGGVPEQMDHFFKRSESSEKDKSSVVNIFAVDRNGVQTTEEHVTGGVGFSSTLSTPEISKRLFYRWQGNIKKTLPTVGTADIEDVETYSERASLIELAKNFAEVAKTVDGYQLIFEPSEKNRREITGAASGLATNVRSLNDEEQVEFMKELKKAIETGASNAPTKLTLTDQPK